MIAALGSNTCRTTAVVTVLVFAAALVAHATAFSVGQAGQAFSVKSLVVAVGDVVSFENNDGVRHNIRILNDNDEMTDVGIQQPGESLRYRFNKAGRFRVRCGIHPGMKLTITAR